MGPYIAKNQLKQEPNRPRLDSCKTQNSRTRDSDGPISGTVGLAGAVSAELVDILELLIST